MNKLSDIADYVNHLPVDLQAETLIALLQKDFIDSGEILTAFDGQLKRTYAKDVSRARLTEFENGEKALTFHLNRDGIYDALPETIFHSFSEEAIVRGDEMARDSMKLKNEEKQARSFFQPFENQIFTQLVYLATKENALFENVYSRVLHGLIPNFWNISTKIPSEYSDRLIRLIPMAHQIVGDIDLTTDAFEFILKEIVSLEFKISNDHKGEAIIPVSSGGGLGDCQLGIDMYSGDRPELPFRIAEVSIGPVCRLDVTQYLGGGWLNELLEYLYSYFIPMEVEVLTTIVPGSEGTEFSLNGPDSELITYLGFNTLL